MGTRSVKTGARRTFMLTDDLCEYIDQLPNRSAWLRDLLENIVIKKESLVTESQVKRLIEEYSRRTGNYLIVAEAAGTGDVEFDLIGEIEAILSVGNEEK